LTTVRTVIHDRRIEVPAPDELPDGTEVILSIGTDVVDDLLGTGIAALYLDRKRGVFERAAVEEASGNRVGIARPMLGSVDPISGSSEHVCH
jgi:hypothetical protein